MVVLVVGCCDRRLPNGTLRVEPTASATPLPDHDAQHDEGHGDHDRERETDGAVEQEWNQEHGVFILPARPGGAAEIGHPVRPDVEPQMILGGRRLQQWAVRSPRYTWRVPLPIWTGIEDIDYTQEYIL